MDHVLACDCGGSKCAFMLCAADGTPVASVSGGTSNSFFESAEQIAEKIRLLLCELSDRAGIDPSRVRAWGGVLMLDPALVAPAVRELFPNCSQLLSYDEYSVNMLASAGQSEGCLAHSGTGSFAHARHSGKDYHYGGLGSYLGDEGSGYHVGLATFTAVKRHLTGLGPATSLTELLFEAWEITPEGNAQDRLWQLARHCIAVNAESRLNLARLTRLTERAAREGDGVARGILTGAAEHLCEHLSVLVNMGWQPEGVLTVSGGTWHCGPDMLEQFARQACARWPGLSFVRPRLEPIGGVALSLLRDGLGLSLTDAHFDRLPRWER